MKNFDPKYNDLPKTEIHCHLEGAIRTQTIIDVAKEYNIKLPAYEAAELDQHVKVYEQMRNLEAVLAAFAIFQNSITSPAVVERIAWELFEGSAKQNIKLFEVRFSPDWAFHGHNLDWDACLEGLVRAHRGLVRPPEGSYPGHRPGRQRKGLSIARICAIGDEGKRRRPEGDYTHWGRYASFICERD